MATNLHLGAAGWLWWRKEVELPGDTVGEHRHELTHTSLQETEYIYTNMDKDKEPLRRFRNWA